MKKKMTWLILFVCGMCLSAQGQILENVNAFGVSNAPVAVGLPAAAGDDASSFTVDNIKYAITASNAVSVTYPNAEQPSSENKSTYTGDIVIPATVTNGGKTYKVTAIGDYAFNYADITSIILPEGIEKLGYKAICQTQIKEITVPNSVTLMDYEALGYNKQLVKIVFGKNIAANKWGDKLCIYGGKKYDVYMHCNAVPELRSYTFSFTGATVHVYPMMYEAFKANAAWNAYDIVGDLWIEFTYQQLQDTIAKYKALLPTEAEVGTDPGFYSAAPVKSLAGALQAAEALDESATLKEINEAINDVVIAYNGLYIYPLNEGYYYIENVYEPGQALYGDMATYSQQGLKAAPFNPDSLKFCFKVTRNDNNWAIQSVENTFYIGSSVGGSSSGKYIALTRTPTKAQIIKWAGGGRFKLQSKYSSTATTPTYRLADDGEVTTFNYAADDAEATRAMWHFRPVKSGVCAMDYNLENVRVRGFVHDFTYSTAASSRVNSYNVAPPERRDQPAPAIVAWTPSATATAQKVVWSLDEDFASSTTVSVKPEETFCEIYNLIPGNTYYYKVVATGADGNESELVSSSFTTSGQVRQIKANSAANMRDLGGWPTLSGYPIHYGKIYRGAEFNGGHSITADDALILKQVGIRSELDLRYDSEAKNITTSPLGTGVTYKRIAHSFSDVYYDGMTAGRHLYKQDLQYVMTCVKANRPVYFHCAIGADRTGTLAFIIEGVLGVSESDLYKDYEITTFSHYQTGRGKSQLSKQMSYIKGIKGNTLEEKFFKYCTDSLGLNAADIIDFKSRMLGNTFATSVALPDDTVNLSVGQTFALAPTVLPADANPTYTYKSSASTVAKVSKEGVITGQKEGTAVITVMAGVVSTEVVVNVTLNPADVNRDGTVDSADIVAVIKEMPDGDKKADVNGDGAIDSADIVAVIKAMK